MNNINIEEIMDDIRKNIETRGYSKKDLKFADIKVLSQDEMGEEFDINIFKRDLHNAYKTRMVSSYRELQSYTPFIGTIVIFIKKVVRKFNCFYIEPIVEDQNKFNDCVVKSLAQASVKFENDKEFEEDVFKRLEELEERCKKLEKMLEER